VKTGEVFEVPDWQVKEFEKLESKGIIERYIERPRIDRKAYTVYSNKSLAAPANKKA